MQCRLSQLHLVERVSSAVHKMLIPSSVCSCAASISKAFAFAWPVSDNVTASACFAGFTLVTNFHISSSFFQVS